MNDSSGELLKCFSEKGALVFHFLELQGFKHEYGISDFSTPKSKLQPVPADYSGFFCVIHRYERGNLKLEIAYGDREFNISATIHTPSFSAALWEIANAIGETLPINGAWVLHLDYLRKTLEGLASWIRKHSDILLSPSPTIVQIVLENRKVRLRKSQKEARRQDMRRDCTKAAEAFRSKDYSSTIAWLAPYEDILSKSQLQKLNLSRKRIQGI